MVTQEKEKVKIQMKQANAPLKFQRLSPDVILFTHKFMLQSSSSYIDFVAYIFPWEIYLFLDILFGLLKAFKIQLQTLKNTKKVGNQLVLQV